MRASSRISHKALIVILSLAAVPAVSFAQTTGGTSGSGSSGGVSNSAAPPPGTNSLGTAQSSGMGSGATGAGSGGSSDAAVNAENRLLDKKLKSICRGC